MSMLRGKRRVLALLEAEVAASGQVGLCSVGSGSGKLEARFGARTGLPVVCVDTAPEHDQFADARSGPTSSLRTAGLSMARVS